MNLLEQYLGEQEEDLASVLNDIKKDIGAPTDEPQEGETEESVEGELGTDEEMMEEEEEDLTIMTYADKMQMVISMIKEFGFSNIDYQIADGKNNLLIKGKFEGSDKAAIKGLGKELEMNISIEESPLEDERTLTKISLQNPVTLDKFLQVFKKEQEKHAPPDMGVEDEIIEEPAE